MRAVLYERRVERYNTPENRSKDRRIKKQGKIYKGVFRFTERPLEGDILVLHSESGDEKYVITDVIFDCFCDNEKNKSYLVDSCICEVVKYRERVLCQNGSDTFSEERCIISFLDDWED